MDKCYREVNTRQVISNKSGFLKRMRSWWVFGAVKSTIQKLKVSGLSDSSKIALLFNRSKV